MSETPIEAIQGQIHLRSGSAKRFLQRIGRQRGEVLGFGIAKSGRMLPLDRSHSVFQWPYAVLTAPM